MDKLLNQLETSDSQQQRLNILELLGYIITMLHWQRGIIDMLIAIKAVPLEGEWLENWHRVIKDLESYEQFAWEIAPARAVLPALRHYRLTGELVDGAETLTVKDNFGRIPYGNGNLDHIEDVLRRIKDCWTYEKGT